MAVYLTRPLFFRTLQDFAPGAADPHADQGVTGKVLREAAESMSSQLAEAAELTEALAEDGWQATLEWTTLCLVNDHLETRQEAEERLKALGVDYEGCTLADDGVAADVRST